MITHGKKQISEIVYARKASEGGGAVRLTNIIRGAQVVFGGLKPSFAWLEKATKAAILAAFGAEEGDAVIKATNYYLNVLAATNSNKASALAGFINEDPMLVCSLGLQSQGVQMPIRWLVGDGNAYINTGIVMKDLSHIFEVTCRWNGTNTGAFQTIFGFMESNTIPRLGLHQYQGNMMFGTNSTVITSCAVDKVARDYIYNATTGNVSRRNIGSVDFSSIGKSGTDTSSFSENTLPIFLFARNNGGHNNGYEGDVARFKDNDSIELIPFKSATREGMVDLVNAAFHPNQGTGHFTIAYTLPDGTPWTPLNQTP